MTNSSIGSLNSQCPRHILETLWLSENESYVISERCLRVLLSLLDVKHVVNYLKKKQTSLHSKADYVFQRIHN